MSKELVASLYLEALVKVEDAVRALNVLKAMDPSRELSIATTEAETAQLWLMAAEGRIPKVGEARG